MTNSEGNFLHRDFPIPKFVELVETNPDVTSAFAFHPLAFQLFATLRRAQGPDESITSSGEIGS